MILRAVLSVVGLCVVAAGLGGCSREHDVVPQTTAAPIVDPTCPRDGQELGLPGAGVGPDRSGAIPPGFEPSQVVWCRVADDAESLGNGTLGFTVTPHTGVPGPALMAALRLPDRQQEDAVCQTNFPLPTYLILVDAEGRGMLPRLPRDPCDQPRKEITTALTELNWAPGEPYQVTVSEPGR